MNSDVGGFSYPDRCSFFKEKGFTLEYVKRNDASAHCDGEGCGLYAP